MNYAERLKAVIALNPEITANRAKLRALFYLHKNNPKKMHIQIFGGLSGTDITLYEHSPALGSSDPISTVHMKPFSYYPATKGEKLIQNAKTTSGVVIKGLKTVWEEFNNSLPINPPFKPNL